MPNKLKCPAHAYWRPQETLAAWITCGLFCKCDIKPSKRFNDKFLLSNHRCFHHRRGHWDRHHLRLSGIQRTVRYWSMRPRSWHGKDLTKRDDNRAIFSVFYSQIAPVNTARLDQLLLTAGCPYSTNTSYFFNFQIYRNTKKLIKIKNSIRCDINLWKE